MIRERLLQLPLLLYSWKFKDEICWLKWGYLKGSRNRDCYDNCTIGPELWHSSGFCGLLESVTYRS